MKIFKLDLTQGTVIKTDLDFATDYEKTMYINEILGRLYSGQMKLSELNKAQYKLLEREIGQEIDMTNLYKFGLNNQILKMA